MSKTARSSRSSRGPRRIHKSKLYKRTFYELTPIAEESHLENIENPEDASFNVNDSIMDIDQKPVFGYSKYIIKKVLMFFALATLIIATSANLYWRFSPRANVTTAHYTLPDNFRTTFPDLTTIKGNSKEAYAIFLCTRDDAESIALGFVDGLQTLVFKLNKLQAKKRDIIVFTCDNTPMSQLNAIQKLGAILIPVERITAMRGALHERWNDLYTKFKFWKLLGWERIAVMDADFVIMNDNWINIWNEPAVQLRNSPPAGFNPEDKFYGVPIKDLYPMIFGSSYDTMNWEAGIKNQEFNGGLYIMKPNLAHYDLFMNLVKDESKVYPYADQTLMNIAYNKTGPLPWVNYDPMYNYQPDHNEVRNDVKAYHWKAWNPNPAPNLEHYGNVPSVWHSQFTEMKMNVLDVKILPEKPRVSADYNSITINELKLSAEAGVLYYMVTSDFAVQPSTMQIKEALLAKKDNKLTFTIGSSKGRALTIGELAPGTNYKVFYFAETFNSYAPVTDVYQFEFSTRAHLRTDIKFMGLLVLLVFLVVMSVRMFVNCAKQPSSETDL